MTEKINNAIEEKKPVIALWSNHGEALDRCANLLEVLKKKGKKTVYYSTCYEYPADSRLCDQAQLEYRPINGMAVNFSAIKRSLLEGVYIIVDLSCEPNGYAKESFLLALGSLRDSYEGKLILILRESDLDLLKNAEPVTYILEVTKPTIRDIKDHIRSITLGFTESEMDRLVSALKGKHYSELVATKDSVKNIVLKVPGAWEHLVDSPKKKIEVDLNDVVGLGNVKEEIERFIDSICNDDESFIRTPYKSASMLLVGPPGSGKTTIAKAVKGEINKRTGRQVHYMEFKREDLYSEYHSVSARQASSFCKEAMALASDGEYVVIFFDEVDSIFRHLNGNSSGETASIINTLLVNIANLATSERICLIGATNRPQDIDYRFLRSGRMDTVFYAGLPKAGERRSYIRKQIVKGINTDLIKELGELTEGFSCADLLRLIQRAENNRRKAKDSEFKIEHFTVVLDQGIVCATVDIDDEHQLKAWVENRKNRR